MKKMLTIIGALGLVTTTGNTLVACSWFDKYEKNADAFLQLNTYEIHLAKRTTEKTESETIEVLDYEERTEQFTKELKKRLEIEGRSDLNITIGVKLYHISGILDIDHKVGVEPTDDKKLLCFAQFKPQDTRGKSTWGIDLYALIKEKVGDFSFEYNNLKPVYFDVIID